MIELSPFRSSGIGVHPTQRETPVEALTGYQRFIASTFQAIYNFLKQSSALWKVLALILDIVTFLVLVWAIDHPVLICVLPLSLGLVPLGVMALWTILIGAHLDEPHLLISTDVVQRGDELRVMYRQRVFKDIHFTYMAVQLVMREWVRYTDGTDTSTAHYDTLYQEKVYDTALRLAADETLERRVVFAVPPDAMHTFIAADNKLHWLIKVRLEMVGRGVYQEEFEVQVLPVTNVTGESVA